jgi:cytoskeletal protein RodZ
VGITQRTMALLGVVLLTAACGSSQTSSAASAEPSSGALSGSVAAATPSRSSSVAPSLVPASPTTSTPPPTAPPTTRGGSARLVLTDKDAAGDATRTVPVGTIIEVDLTVTPPDAVGAARSTNEAVVAMISARGDEFSASQSVFRAVAPGTANLGAMIFAACARNMGCAAAAGYSVAISVVPAR